MSARPLLPLLALMLAPLLLAGQTTQSAPSATNATSADAACRACIQAHEEFLASNALRGRGSGTHDELVAATYIASELRAYGIAPAAPHGYIETAPTPHGTTASVLGMLSGTDPAAPALLLSAHLDHLGVQPARAVNGDDIFNGANDDASGCSAVLELARTLALGPRPRRTVYFAFFGSEETGGYGARYFVAHPPIPLDRFFANLEFEMIGWPDPAVPAHTLWLTGWNRSTLGPTLAGDGAHLVADPHPAQHFFCRSDNYDLAVAGVVAQTISSFGLQSMYHQPDDDLAHLDLGLMTQSIASLITPIRNLLNSSALPEWKPGGRPTPGRGCS